MTKKEISFEKKLEELNEIVEKLEDGDLPLKESLEKFKGGVDIIKQCQKELESAELKIETIMKKDGKITTEPFKEK